MEKINTEYKWFRWVSTGAIIIGIVFLALGFSKAFATDLPNLSITLDANIPDSGWYIFRKSSDGGVVWVLSSFNYPSPFVNYYQRAYTFTSWYQLVIDNSVGKIKDNITGNYFCAYGNQNAPNYGNWNLSSPVASNYICPDTATGTIFIWEPWYLLDFWSLEWWWQPRETCTDGIKNQDETEIDYGWVCWTCIDWIKNGNEIGVDYGWRCEAYNGPVSYKWCETVKQYVSGTGATNLMFWYVSTPSNTYMYTASWSQWYNNESVAVYNWTANRDVVELYNFQYQWSQVIQTGSIVFDWTTASKIVTPTSGSAQMFFMSFRSWNTQKFNFLKFGWAIASISTVGNIDNHVGDVEFNVPWYWTSTAPLVLSGGVAVAYTKNWVMADSAIITFERTSKFFQFSSFGIYSLSSYYNITNCGNGSYTCQNVYRWNDTFACSRNPRAWIGTAVQESGFSWSTAIGTLWGSYSPSQYYSDVSCNVGTATVPVIINTQWDMTTVSWPSCIPNKTDWTLTTKDWFQVDYTTNGSGAITSVNVKPLPFDSKVMCAGDEYDWISWSLKCVLKFFFYYYDKMTGTQEDTMKLLSTAIQVWYTKGKQAPSDITLGTKPNEKPTNALALAGYNAWDRTASWTNGISQTYRLWKYALYILITVVVISMMFYFLNRKQ